MIRLSLPGTYALVLRCPRAAEVEVGALGAVSLRRGYLLYVGSAFGPGGVAGRLRHHLRAVRRPRWHVDYLRPYVEPAGAWWGAGDRDVEHRWAAALAYLPGATVALPRFGASDCRCASHLLAVPRSPRGECVREVLRRVTPRVEVHFAARTALARALADR